MNIGEANAVNVVLRTLLGLPEVTTHEHPSADRVGEAAEMLARKANKALHAGLTEVEVRQAWTDRRAQVWEARR